jgi:hypothetical protein
MSASRLRSLTVVLVFLLSVVALSSAQTKASCQFHSLTAPSSSSFGLMQGINDYGTVVGSAAKAGAPGQFVGATVFSSGSTTFYSVPNSYSTGFSKRNDSGITVGSYADYNYPQHNQHGIVLHGSTLVKVNYPGAINTGLTGINKWGSIVGYGQMSGSAQTGFKLVNGSYQKIAFPGFSSSTTPMAISDTGVIVGTYDVYSPTVHGFVFANGTYRKFDYPATNVNTYLYDVNASGEIVGDYLVNTSGTFAQGFIYKNGAFKTVNYPGATNTQVWGLSNKGVIVGNWSNLYTQGAFTAVCQ